jgi:hypothetical protein
MVKGPLPNRLEFAILQIMMTVRDGTHQASWGPWANDVSRLVPDLASQPELKAAFTRLWRHGYLRLTKWSVHDMQHVEYSGQEQDDSLFFFTGDFMATITDEGRSYWGTLNAPTRNGVFISHITEEKPVAHVLQKYIKLAFSDKVPVFVSSDGRSIGGGKKWYNHIIENLRLSEVVLVLVSQESKGREWINFEAGFGEGMESLVVPVAIQHMSRGQLAFPLAGIQVRRIDDIGLIVDDIGKRLDTPAGTIDTTAYSQEIEEAEVSLVYKSLKVEPVPDGNLLNFDITNVGNVDLELLMLEVYVPEFVRGPGFGFGDTNCHATVRNGTTYFSSSCYSNRGVCGNSMPLLRPIITPSMGTVRPSFQIPIRRDLDASQREFPIFYQIHAIGYRTEEESRKLSEIPNWVVAGP